MNRLVEVLGGSKQRERVSLSRVAAGLELLYDRRAQQTNLAVPLSRHPVGSPLSEGACRCCEQCAEFNASCSTQLAIS